MIARTQHCTFFNVSFGIAARLALMQHDPLIYMAWQRENKLRSR